MDVAASSAGKCRVGEAASTKEVRDGGQKISRAFATMPFKTSRKKSSRSMDNNNEDGFLFKNVMCMMMHKNWIKSKQRERQNKQGERQHKIDAKQRERKYQLCREEMAIACKDACVQRQLMNVMMMA